MQSSDFCQAECIKLVTYRKSGAEVATPVWFVVHQGQLYFRTAMQFGKIKRLRNNPQVKYAACDWHGNAEGRWEAGEAELLTAEDKRTAGIDAALDQKYGDKRAEMTQFMQKEAMEPVFVAITPSQAGRQ